MTVPRLRFKEFSGEWEIKTLSYVCNKIMDGTHFSPKSTEGAKKYLTSKNIRNTGLDISNCNYISEKEHQEIYKKCPVKLGDVLLTKDGANTGNCCINTLQEEFSLLSSVAVLNGKENLLNTLFLLQILQGFKGINTINNAMAGQAISRITLEKINKFKFSFPKFPEQTKIANFLTTVDEKIAQLTQKGELLARYKKGVMQLIFSQQLRFKDDDGREFPAWEEKKLGDVFSFMTTNSFSRELLTYDDGIVKNIHYGDIHTKFKSNFKIENENAPYISNNINISKISEDCYCKKGDLIIADASEDYADIGKSIEIISLNSQKLLAGLHTYIARDLSKQMALGFSGYLMQTENVRLQIKTLATGVSVLGISKGNLAKVNLGVPSKPEQIKIANFLTALDDKLSNNQTQLNALKQYKQGLLQQLFV